MLIVFRSKNIASLRMSVVIWVIYTINANIEAACFARATLPKAFSATLLKETIVAEVTVALIAVDSFTLDHVRFVKATHHRSFGGVPNEVLALLQEARGLHLHLSH